MNNPFSQPFDQFGIVVPDLEKTLTELLKLGVGPWFTVRDAKLKGYEYQGVASEPILDVAFAQKGSVQLELIHQTNDAASAYKDFVAAGGDGFHHFGWFRDDFAESQQEAEALDSEILQKGSWNGVNFVYYQTTEAVPTPPELDELSEAIITAVTAAAPADVVKIGEMIELNDMSRAVFGYVREAEAKWDGKSDPVRSLMSISGRLHIGVDVLSQKLERLLHGHGH